MTNSLCFISPSSYGYFLDDVEFTGGGAQRQISLLSRELANQFDVHVVVGDYGQESQIEVDGITLHRSYSVTGENHFYTPALQFSSLLKAMRRADADIYIDRNTPRLTSAVYLASRILQKKFVYHVGNDENLRNRAQNMDPVSRRLFTQSVSKADLVVTQKYMQSKILEDRYRKPSTTIPNGYPQSSERPKFDKREYFLWVGSLQQEHKQPHILLDVAESLPKKQFKMIGPVNETKEYQVTIRDRAESLQNVDFVGEVPPDTIGSYYERAIALISTSAFEGFPNVFLEAWRVGTPVLSLHIALSEFIEISLGSLEGSRGDLKKYIERLSEDPEFWEDLSISSKSEFESRFTIHEVGSKYAQAIGKLFDQP